MREKIDGTLRVEISDGGLSAFAIIQPPEKGAAAITLEELRDKLAIERVTFGIHPDGVLASGVARGRKVYSRFEVARGREPGNGTDAYLDLFWTRKNPKANHEHDGDVDHRETGMVESVNSEEIIARKVSAAKGTHGTMVTGEIIPGIPGKDRVFIGGRNVEALHDGMYFKSLINGVPRVSGNILSVHPVYIVDGNVDYSIGNINFSGTVIVKGSVVDGFTVNADEDVYVKGNIDASYVTAGGNVEVEGGILTRYSGYVVAGKNLYARYIRNSIVEAEGDIYVSREIVDSFVRSNRSIRCESGDGRITGGDIMARDEIYARQLGSRMETATVLRTGMNFKSYLLVKETEQALQQTEFELRDIEKSLIRFSGNDADALATLKEKQLSLIDLKKALKDEISALAEIDSVNYGATVKCECDAYTGVIVYIGENAKRVKQKMKHVMFQCDEDFSVRLGFRFESGKEIIETLESRRTPGPRAKREKCIPSGNDALRVVVVDGSEFSLKKAGYILKAEGFEVSGNAANMDDAMDMFRKHSPSIVMIDLKSLNGDAGNVVNQIKSMLPKVNIVLTVGTTVAPEMVRDIMRCGPVNFILKPLHRDQVADVLNRVVCVAEARKLA